MTVPVYNPNNIDSGKFPSRNMKVIHDRTSKGLPKSKEKRTKGQFLKTDESIFIDIEIVTKSGG